MCNLNVNSIENVINMYHQILVYLTIYTKYRQSEKDIWETHYLLSTSLDYWYTQIFIHDMEKSSQGNRYTLTIWGLRIHKDGAQEKNIFQ